MTAGSAAEAKRIARALVEERLAACVNVVPRVASYYRWEGRLTVGAEVLLIAKTTRAHTRALEARVRALHSYSVPEVLVLGPSAGSADYLGWVAASVGAPPQRRAARR